jgi:2-keto-4-pentenoate hydratase/2-oxohepta-3-ene-1,7-dioic acid hydratase in catechol pathway
MHIVRYLYEGQTRYGILEGDRVIPWTGDPFTELTKEGKAIDLSAVRLLAPVIPPNIICLGLNYRKHADEGGMRYPDEPLVFLKTTTALSGPGDPIVIPEDYPDQIDYEVELVMVIGKKAKNISEEEVPKVVLGYTIGNDVSNRAAQFKDKQWCRGKSHDTFCPIGPAIVTGLDGDNLDLSCRLDGQVMQDSNTSDMIFSCRQIVSFLSRNMTLLPGTIILTGTPSGVGFARTPPVFLKAGQTVECCIQGIGVLTNPVVGASKS